MAPYFIHFQHKWKSMRVPELDAVAQLFGIEVGYDKAALEALALDHKGIIGEQGMRHEAEMRETSSLLVDLRSDEDAAKLASRLILVDSISELWGHGVTWEETLAMCMRSKAALIEPHIREGRTFRVRVEALGVTYKTEDQVALIQERLGGLDLKGKVRLTDPDNSIIVLMDFPIGTKAGPATPPRHIYIGRRVAKAPGLKFADKYRLPHRCFLGPTSLDHQLSMIIANQAHARPGALVLDPFCGTASILVGCAAYGAHVLGADLDGRMLVGKGAGKTIADNFKQYGLGAPIGLQRADFAAASDCWRMLPFLDAIVCDPPYGVRASSKKLVAGASDQMQSRPDIETYTPQRERLDINPLLERLLEYAASRLVLGGRLVFLLPTTTDMRGSGAPEHPALRLCAESEQPISTRWCRRLVTMEKVRENEEGMRVSFDRREASIFDTAKLGKDNPHLKSKRWQKAELDRHAEHAPDDDANSPTWGATRTLALVGAVLASAVALLALRALLRRRS
ncbi:S-adenosyl-L-methionine-dependent methyltransferase [Pavlovales sp. CCMP2436]|nr:S-adenosyl-L-methionine-dependent methyltransferase [Pavlovales sp. CCMP2436]